LIQETVADLVNDLQSENLAFFSNSIIFPTDAPRVNGLDWQPLLTMRADEITGQVQGTVKTQRIDGDTHEISRVIKEYTSGTGIPLGAIGGEALTDGSGRLHRYSPRTLFAPAFGTGAWTDWLVTDIG
jgi:hypothetical protein